MSRTRVEKLVNDHPLYNIWCMIKQRCYNPKHTAYRYYGGRGIKMCDRWKDDFYLFLADVGDRPSNKHSIDRYPNKDGDYSPDNFRWADINQQAKNRNKKYSFTKYER